MEKEKKKGSWLKGLIFEDVEDKNKTDVAVINQPAPVGTPTAQPVYQAPTVAFQATPSIDKDMEASIYASLESQKQAGQDYFDFQKAIRALASFQMTEEQKFASVFATFTVTSGVSKELLIASAQRYLALLDKEDQEFNEGVETKLVQHVQGPLAQVEEIKKTMAQKEEMILKLQQELQAHQQEMHTVQNKVVEAQSKIQGAKNTFQVTLNSVRETFKSNIQKIQSIIQQ